jgi:hypothetical protein
MEFILTFRLDTKMSLGYSWLLLSWIPDTATIRLKMLYASTKSTLKTEFGSSYIEEEVHATSKVKLMIQLFATLKLTHCLFYRRKLR